MAFARGATRCLAEANGTRFVWVNGAWPRPSKTNATSGFAIEAQRRRVAWYGICLSIHDAMNSKIDRLTEILSHFDTAMLVTHDEDGGIRARPLTVADHDADGSLWFFTASESGKTLEIRRDASVAVVMQDERRFVSVSGVARLDSSHERLKQLWRESFRPWFPGGPDDRSAIAVHVEPIAAEIWDLTGSKGMAYALHALRALVSRNRADTPPDASFHVKVEPSR
jgi:general stress protein 26